MLQEVLKI